MVFAMETGFLRSHQDNVLASGKPRGWAKLIKLIVVFRIDYYFYRINF